MIDPTGGLAIRVLHPPPVRQIEPLADESTREGFRFVRRLLDEHAAGQLRFDGPGEVLLGAFDGDELVAIGGVTRDPYGGDPHVGRVRHVYVRPSHRHRGVGARLIAALEEHARGHFTALVLRTDTAAAARFYQALGYAPLPSGGTATHRRELPVDLSATA